VVNAPRLADLRPAMQRFLPQWPDALAGAIKLDGTIEGAPRNPGLVLDARAKALQWGTTLRAATLDVALRIAPGVEGRVAYDRREVQITASATGLGAPRTELESARIEVGGTLARHHGAITIAGAQFAIAAGFDGGLRPQAWEGTDD
jgi:autotransporter translocation and assembly factor TamB